MANIKRRAIAFNLDDPFQKELYEYTLKFTNFSYYGKSLIQKDISGYVAEKELEVVEDSVEINDEVIEGFI